MWSGRAGKARNGVRSVREMVYKHSKRFRAAGGNGDEDGTGRAQCAISEYHDEETC